MSVWLLGLLWCSKGAEIVRLKRYKEQSNLVLLLKGNRRMNGDFNAGMYLMSERSFLK